MEANNINFNFPKNEYFPPNPSRIPAKASPLLFPEMNPSPLTINQSIYPPIYASTLIPHPPAHQAAVSSSFHHHLAGPPSQSTPVIIPIDPILLQIDADQRTALGLPPFSPGPMAPMTPMTPYTQDPAPFSHSPGAMDSLYGPVVSSGLKTVAATGGVPALNVSAVTTAAVKRTRKRVYLPRKKPGSFNAVSATNAAGTAGAASADQGKRKRKPRNQTKAASRAAGIQKTKSLKDVPSSVGVGQRRKQRKKKEEVSTAVDAGQVSVDGGQYSMPPLFLFDTWVPLVSAGAVGSVGSTAPVGFVGSTIPAVLELLVPRPDPRLYCTPACVRSSTMYDVSRPNYRHEVSYFIDPSTGAILHSLYPRPHPTVMNEMNILSPITSERSNVYTTISSIVMYNFNH
ncbi:hypothetical protein BZA77DRAFT_297402 [Pyronema omphalodes]|nr:hypothetical protein BZA77DRAFT_297402 [Pyronema omphalodes]